jgi:hypothetical protein
MGVLAKLRIENPGSLGLINVCAVNRKDTMKSALILLLGLTLSMGASQSFANADAYGSLYPSPPTIDGISTRGPRAGLDTIRRWNEIAINASGFDHATAHEQLGPGRSSRAMAIVHIAIFDAINAVVGGYESYTGVRMPTSAVSLDAAISQAAHDTLTALFPAQAASFDTWLGEDLAAVKDKKLKANGIDLGHRTAATLMALREHDGSEHPEVFLGPDWITSDLPGHWRMDPISQIQIVLGARWGECLPFAVESSSQFRAPPFPSMTSPEYASAFNEAKAVGGDGVVTPTARTPDQTHAGLFWAYDGTPSLCAPPRLYNQIIVQIADQMGTSGIELARLLALANVAMADATLTCWESKFFYDIWRPITGIRESDAGTGPSGAGDGNPDTIGDPAFSPLGAPASNLNGPNFTPPFPAYPSGHASMGGAMFQTLRRFYGTDDIAFSFVSDEFNGITRGSDGNVRPLLPRSFSSLSQAEDENGQSRIYLGIHWSLDKTAGISMGNQVADYVISNVFLPMPPRTR